MKNNSGLEEFDTLQRSRDFLQAVIDNIGDPTMVTDVNYHILLSNRALRKVFDRRDPIAEHLNCFEVIHHLDMPCLVACPGVYPCPINEVLSTKKPCKVIHTNRDLLNNEIFMEVIGCPVFDETGGVVQIVESFRNITKYKQEAERLEDLIFDLQRALSRVKRLSGLLPICMSCKRIRNDKGEWKNLEAYIRSHSEAEFTHGLCPGCEKSLYGELVPSLDAIKRTLSDLLRSEHEELHRIFEDYISKLDAGNMTLALQKFDEFQVGLLRHINKEEEILFPAYEKKGGIIIEPIQAMKMEHQEIKRLIREIADLLSEGRSRVSKTGVIKELRKQLHEYLKLHCQEEVNGIYLLCDLVIRGKEKDELIRKIEAVQ